MGSEEENPTEEEDEEEDSFGSVEETEDEIIVNEGITSEVVSGEEIIEDMADETASEEVVSEEITDESVSEEFIGGDSAEESVSEEDTVVKGGLTKEEKEYLASQIEAALFLAGRPLGELELANFLGTDRITVRWALRRIKRLLSEQNSSLEVLHLTKDRWVLQLCEEFSRGLYDYIAEFIPKEEMLSREEVDTLTEIAYRQPITSTQLVKILGRPNVYDHIRNLTEKGLIVVEKQERANVLQTSKKFADIYGFDTAMRNLKIQLVWRLKKRAKIDKTDGFD